MAGVLAGVAQHEQSKATATHDRRGLAGVGGGMGDAVSAKMQGDTAAVSASLTHGPKASSPRLARSPKWTGGSGFGPWAAPAQNLEWRDAV